MNVMSSHWTNREPRSRLSWSNYIILITEGVVERAQTQGVSHISLAQYSMARIERSSLLLLLVGPLYPHAQTRSTSLSLGTFQNKHALAHRDRAKARSQRQDWQSTLWKTVPWKLPWASFWPQWDEWNERKTIIAFFLSNCYAGKTTPNEVLISNAFVLLK